MLIILRRNGSATTWLNESISSLHVSSVQAGFFFTPCTASTSIHPCLEQFCMAISFELATFRSCTSSYEKQHYKVLNLQLFKPPCPGIVVAFSFPPRRTDFKMACKIAPFARGSWDRSAGATGGGRRAIPRRDIASIHVRRQTRLYGTCDWPSWVLL